MATAAQRAPAGGSTLFPPQPRSSKSLITQQPSDLPAGAKGIRVDNAGDMFEPPSAFPELDELNTTPALLVAEAWKLLSKSLKGSLLLHLAGKPLVATLLDQLVGAWRQMYGSCAAAAAAGNSWGAAGGSGTGDLAATSCSKPATPHLEREPFDVAAAAYQLFESVPADYGWIAGSSEHKQAVAALRSAIHQVLEAEIPGPWAASGGDDWREPNRCDGRSMSDAELDSLVLECRTALSVRRHRNESAAHPFSDPDACTRQRLLDLLKRIVDTEYGVVKKMPRLAGAAIKHVEQELNTTAEKQLVARKVQVPVFFVGGP